MNCDRCTHPDCCLQAAECDGHNWDFMQRTPQEWMEWIREANITIGD